MKNLRKSLVLILVFVLVLAMFVACNKDGGQGAGGNNNQSQGEQGGNGEQGGGEQGGGNQGGQGEQSPYFDYNLSEIFAKYAENWNFKAQYDEYVMLMDTPNNSATLGFIDEFTYSFSYTSDGVEHTDYNAYGDGYYLDNLDGTYSKYADGTSDYQNNSDSAESYVADLTALTSLTFEHFDLESIEGMSEKFNQYVAKDPVEAGKKLLGEFVESDDEKYISETYWTRIEVHLRGDDIYQVVGYATCDYMWEDEESREVLSDSYQIKDVVTFSDFGQVNFDLSELTIKNTSGGSGETPVEPKTYSIVFTDQYLGANSTDIVFETTSVANSMDKNRGIQYMQKNGTVQIISKGSLTNVTSVTLELSSNADNGMNVEVLVGSTNLLCNGTKTGTVAKRDHTSNATLTFSASEALDGKLTIKLIPTGNDKSMYIKSVEVICGGTTGGGGTTPTPTEVMPAQKKPLEDRSTLYEKMKEYGENENLPLLPTGNHNYLVVPVQFTDYPFSDTNDIEKLKKAFNGTAADTGWQSVSSYYRTSSYGKLNMTFDIQPVYTAKKTSTEYDEYQELVGTYNGKNVYKDGSSLLFQEIVAALDGQIDYTKYDQDNNGYLDAIWIIYSAPVDYNPDSFYWAYVTQYMQSKGETTKYDGLDLGNYLFAGVGFMNEFTGNANDKYKEQDMTISGLNINASTYIHETGHLLGLDDYYDYDVETGSLGGLGSADMMDQTVGDQNAYSKMILGWLTPTLVNTTQTISIKSLQEADGTCLLIPLDFDGSYFSEYLLIDLYTNTGLNAAHANQNNSFLFYDEDTQIGAPYGVRIYHVSSDIDNPYSDDHYSFTTNNNSYSDIPLIEYVRANGKSGYELEYDSDYKEYNKEYGDSTDLWQAGQKLSTVFPNYARNDNKKVNFDIEIVSVSAASATITITFAA